MQRFAITGALMAILMATGAVTGQESEAKVIIRKAITAQGGFDKVASTEATYSKIHGDFFFDPFKFTGEAWSESGNRYKNTLRGADDNDANVYTLVRNGTNSWHSINDRVETLDEEKRRRLEKSAHSSKVAGLLSLLRDKGYTFTVLGDSTIKKNVKVVAVKVQYPNQYDSTLYFDKNTGLLVKSSHLMLELSAKLPITRDVYFSAYKTCDPVAGELQTLQERKQATDSKALLAMLQARIPTKEEHERMAMLVGKLGDSKFAVRQKASAELQQCGPKAAVQLREALRSEDREVSRRAEQILEVLAKDGESSLLSAALRLLAARGSEGAVETLLAYVPWAYDDLVARDVLNALEAINGKQSQPHPLLVQALQDADKRKRKAAEAVLGKDGGAYLKQPGRRLFVEGLVLPHHLTVYHDGKLYLEYDIDSFQFFNRFDDGIFARP